ncbi:MAG TPA: glycosyltransferase [Myxococcales bacterium]
MSGDLLKVLYCSFDVIPEPTGTSARATDFIRGLTPLFNVDGLTVKSADHSHIERYFGMRLMRVPVGAGDLPVRAQTFERAVRRQLESDEYQLVHFTDPYGGYALCETRTQYNFKLVYEVTGFPSVEVKYTHPHLEGDRRFMSKLRRQELFCLMNADAVLVGSDQTAAMVQSLGVSPEKTTVIRSGADCSLYLPISEMPLPDRVPMRLLYLGNQNAWQGLSTLLFAMSIASQLAEVRLAIVGPQHPTWRLQLEEMVKYRKLAGLVEFLDPVVAEELPKVLGAADVGVAPLEKNDRNTVQGAPVNKIAHYLAAGRPVIAANLPLVREITNDSCALYYEPGDENDLAEKIVALARDPARRVSMGEQAHLFAKEKLHADHGRTKLLKLFSGMLGGQTVAAPEAPREEQSSYAPTSVGEKALPDESTQNRDVNTLTYDSSTKRDSISDPFRKLIAQTAAQMSEPVPDSLAPPGPGSDGPPTPRGIAVASAEAEPTSTAEPASPTPPAEAPAATATAESAGTDDLRIDDVDPLEYDFNSPDPGPAASSRGITAPAIQLPILGDGFGLQAEDQNPPPPEEPSAPTPVALPAEANLEWGGEPAQLEFKGMEGDAEAAAEPAVSEEAQKPPDAMEAFRVEEPEPVAAEAAEQGEDEEEPLFKSESETVRWDDPPGEPAPAVAPIEEPAEEPVLPVEVEAPAVLAEPAAVVAEESLTVTLAVVEEEVPAGVVEEQPSEPDLVVVEAKADLPPVAAKSEPALEEVAEAAFEVISDSPSESPIAAETLVEQLEPDEETTVMPEPMPAGPTTVSSEEIEVVEAELDGPAAEHHKAAAPFADVPWEVEPQGEAERQAAIERAAATMPPPEPMPPPSVSTTEEVVVGDQDLEVVEVAAETPVEAAVQVAAEATPEEVFEVEEVIPEAPATVEPEPPPKPAPSNIVADFLKIDKPGTAPSRSSQNAVTLRMPSFRSAALVAASAPQTPAPATAPGVPASAPAAAIAPAAKPPVAPAAKPPVVISAPVQAPVLAAAKPALGPSLPTTPMARQPTGQPPAPQLAPASGSATKPAAAAPSPVASARSAAPASVARPTPVPVAPAPVAGRPVQPAPVGPGAMPTGTRPAVGAPPTVGPPVATPAIASRPAASAPMPAAVQPKAAAAVTAPVPPSAARPGMPPPWETKPVVAAQPAKPVPVAASPSLPVTVRPAPGQAPQLGVKPPVVAPPVLGASTRQSGTRPAANPAVRPQVAPRSAPPVLYRSDPPAKPGPAASAARTTPARPASKPSRPGEQLIELDAAEVVTVPTSLGVQTPPSGLPPSDEWLGHVLLGYAPFNVAIVPRTVSGEIPLLDPSKASANLKR